MNLRPRLARQLVMTPCVAMLLAGCSSWQTRPQDPDTVIAGERPPQARFMTSYGNRVTLRDPMVQDSLFVGTERGRTEFGDPTEWPRSIPTADVTRVEVWARDPLRTAILSVALAGAFATFMIIAAVSLNGSIF